VTQMDYSAVGPDTTWPPAWRDAEPGSISLPPIHWAGRRLYRGGVARPPVDPRLQTEVDVYAVTGNRRGALADGGSGGTRLTTFVGRKANWPSFLGDAVASAAGARCRGGGRAGVGKSRLFHESLVRNECLAGES